MVKITLLINILPNIIIYQVNHLQSCSRHTLCHLSQIIPNTDSMLICHEYVCVCHNNCIAVCYQKKFYPLPLYLDNEVTRLEL